MKFGITLQPFYFYYSKYKENTLFQFTLLAFSFANNNKDEEGYFEWSLLDIEIDIDYDENNYKFFDCKKVVLFGFTIYQKEFQDWKE